MDTLKALCQRYHVEIWPTAEDWTAGSEVDTVDSYHASLAGKAGTLPVRIVSVSRGEKAPTGEEILAQWLGDISGVDGVTYSRWVEVQGEINDEWSLDQFGEHQRLLEELKECLRDSFQELC
jgi:hypothetical protein